MVHPVSSSSVSQAVVHQKAAQPKPQQASSASQKDDAVQLSPEAKVKAGDVNHGG
jgi:hypothetical protein